MPTQPIESSTSLGYRVAAWKAMPLFALVGGALGGLQMLLGLLQGDASAVSLILTASSLLPWALAGGLYAYLVNRRGLSATAHRTRIVQGALAGALTLTTTGVLATLIFWSWLFENLPGEFLAITLSVLLFALVFVGALQGSLTGLLVGRYVVEPTKTGAV